MVLTRKAWAAVGLSVALVAASAWALTSLLFGPAEPPALHGARLGLSVRELRRQFSPPGPGAFRAVAVSPATGDLALEWIAEPVSAAATVALARARFEFHAGRLVAVRATLPASEALAHGPGLDAQPAWVVSRESPGNQGVLVSIIARDCPAHAAEVRALLEADARR
jgi:hypothetical protein